MADCTCHLDFCGENCPECQLPIDAYGNTEAQFEYCCFPDCGCDGARLCMAPSGASIRSLEQNVESMWRGGTPERIKAVGALMASVAKDKKEPNHG